MHPYIAGKMLCRMVFEDDAEADACYFLTAQEGVCPSLPFYEGFHDRLNDVVFVDAEGRSSRWRDTRTLN